MTFKEKLKEVSTGVAAVASAVAMGAAPLEAQADQGTPPSPSVIRLTTEELDSRVSRGALINGETKAERAMKWKTMKAEKGAQATLKAIQDERIEKIEIPHKDEKGYTFETYEPGKRHVFESYYPNGVLQAKTGDNGQEAEGFYPDGSRKFVRTADGLETQFHPGGKKGEEKIKATPHQLYDAYDVLDEEGRRLEHHHAVTESQRHSADGDYTVRDVKRVDLYNPQSQQVEGTYTLDGWGVKEGRIASIGFVDETGTMRTMDFPRKSKIGDNNYYAASLDVDQIKEIYHEEQQERNEKALQQQALQIKGVEK